MLFKEKKPNEYTKGRRGKSISRQTRAIDASLAPGRNQGQLKGCWARWDKAWEEPQVRKLGTAQKQEQEQQTAQGGEAWGRQARCCSPSCLAKPIASMVWADFCGHYPFTCLSFPLRPRKL